MWSFLAKRLKPKLAVWLDNFDVDSQLEINVVRGHIRLQNFSLAAKPLEQIMHQLCCFVPLVVDEVSVQELTVEVGLRAGIKVRVSGVRVQARTLPPTDWDLNSLRETHQAAKRQKLDIHQRLIQLGQSEGDGFFHSLSISLLDALDLEVEDVEAELQDESSLSLSASGSEQRSFQLGGGFTKASLLPSGSSSSVTVLRHVAVDGLFAWLDVAPAAHRTASVGRVSSAQLTRSYTGPGAEVSHKYMLAPSSSLQCEVALLKCRAPASTAVIQRSRKKATGATLTEYDFCFLGSMDRMMGSLSPDDTEGMVLPHTGVGASLSMVTLTLCPPQVEALLAWVAYSILGFGSVLRAVRSAEGSPIAPVIHQYKHAWLQATFLGEVNADSGGTSSIPATTTAAMSAMRACPDSFSAPRSIHDSVGSGTQELIEAFERSTPVEAIIRARDEAIASVMEELKVASTSAGGCSVGCQLRSFLGIQSAGRADQNARRSDWDFVVNFAREALALRNAHWRSSWERLRRVTCPILVAGLRCSGLTLDFEIEDDESARLATGCTLPQGSSMAPLRLKMDSLDAGASMHRDKQSAQLSLTRFSLEDHFGPKRLEILASVQEWCMPISTVLVKPAIDSTFDWGNAPETVQGDESRLCAGIGRRFQRSVTEEPDGTLCLKSFGVLQVCVPPTQLVVLCMSLLNPSLLYTFDRCFAGVPWRRFLPEEVLELVDDGAEAAREHWAQEAQGYSDKWKLEISMEPVKIFFPVPSTMVQDTWWGVQGWCESYVLCLGRVEADSILQPRQSGAPDIQHLQESVCDSNDIAGADFYDRYGAQILQVSIEKYTEVGGLGSKSRTLMKPASVETALFICHWTAVDLPQASLQYLIGSVELTLLTVDLHAIVSMLSEVLGVATALTKAAALKALKRTKQRLMELRVASSTSAGAGARQRRRPKDGNFMGKLNNLLFGQKGASSTKLWEVKLVLEDVNVHVASSSEYSLPSRGSSPHVEIKLRQQRMTGYACLDGSMYWSFSLANVEVAGPSHGVGREGIKLYRSPPPRQSRKKQPPHISLDWLLVAPDDPDGEWLLSVDVDVKQPTICLWWPTLLSLIKVALRTAGQVQDHRINRRARRDTTSSALDIETLLDFKRKTKYAKRFPFDRVCVNVHVRDIEVLMPIVWDPRTHHITANPNKDSGASLPERHPRVVAFSGELAQRPMLSIKTAFHFSSDMHWPYSQDDSLDSEVGPALAALPNAEVRITLAGLASDVVVPEVSTLRGARPWQRRSAQRSLKLLGPCRVMSHLTSSGSVGLRYEASSEPMTLHVYPATVGLMLDFFDTLVFFGNEVLGMSREFISTEESKIPSAGVTPRRSLRGMTRSKSESVSWLYETPELGISFVGKLPCLLVSFANMPGKVESFGAELGLEDLCFQFSGRWGGLQNLPQWSVRSEGSLRLEAWNGLALQTEPIVEPVNFQLRLISPEPSQAARRPLGPKGKLSISWVNLNLPVGFIYSLKLWQKAEEALRTAAAAEGGEAVFTSESVSSQATTPARNVSFFNSEANHVNEPQDRVAGCKILNALGEPISAKAVPSLGGKAAPDSLHWTLIQPTDFSKVAQPDEGQFGNDPSPPASVSSVPPMLLRGFMQGNLFEVTLTVSLAVGQYEVIRLQLPSQGTLRSASLLLRGVPEEGGEGCALLICTPIFIRNNTGRALRFSVPRTDRTGQTEMLLQDEEEDSDVVGRHHADTVHEVNSSVRWQSANRNTQASSPPPGMAAGPTTKPMSPAGTDPNDFSRRWRRLGGGGGRANSKEGSASPSTGASMLSPMGMSETIDEVPLVEVEAADLHSSRRILPRAIELLPLLWIISASEERKPNQLHIGLDGSATRRVILPHKTLRELGKFDFRIPHREEELRGLLHGCVLQLADPLGNPIHLCCTVNVGLLGDTACCLEIAISSCVSLVNNLPVPLSVTYTCPEDEFEQQQREVELTIAAGASRRVDLHMDEVSMILDPHSDERFQASINLATMQVDEESYRVFAGPMAKVAMKAGASSAAARFQRKELERKGGAKGITFRVLLSSDLSMDPSSYSLGPMASWLEQLSFFHPPEWTNFRRSATIYVRYWLENCSSVDLFMRPLGGGVLTDFVQRMEAGERYLLPQNLGSAAAATLSLDPNANSKRAGIFVWQGRGRKLTTHLRCPGLDGEVANVSVSVTPAPLPFGQSQIIRVFDSVTILNLLDFPMQCWSIRSRWGRGKRTAAPTDCGIVVHPSQEHSDEGLARLEAAPTGTVRFMATWVVEEFEHTETGGTPSSARANSKSGYHQIPLDSQISSQFRMRKSRGMSSYTYANVNVTIQKLQQGAATLVTFDYAEPVFFLKNDTSASLAVKQRGVSEEVEQLFPGAELPFLWYDPKGELEFIIKVWNSNRGGTGVAPDWMEEAAEDNQFSIAVDFNIATGREVRRIMETSKFKKWEASRLATRREKTTNLNQGAFLGKGESGTADALVNQEDRRFDFKFDGLAIALSDASPMQFLYVALDHLTLSIRRSKGNPLAPQDPSNKQDLRRSASGVNESFDLETTLADFEAQDLVQEFAERVASIAYSSTMQRVEATQAIACVAALACVTMGLQPPSGAAFAGMSTARPDDTTPGPTYAQRLVQFLPPLDFDASIFNLQADSHVPGSFFPCVVRPYECRSQLWRSLSCWDPKDYKRPLRNPVFAASVESFRLIGQSVVIKSCTAQLDDLVVNVDEALLVAMSSYYCRVAVYFNLPPFRHAATTAPGMSTAGRRPSWHEGSSDHAPAGSAPASTAPSALPSQFELRTGNQQRLAGLEARKFERKNWLVRVDDELAVGDTTAYVSMRLLEATTPYVENLQRDAHTGVLLGMLTPFYSAAVFQPAMLSASSRKLWQQRICVRPKVLGNMFEEHFVEPIKQQFVWLLVASFDFIGNPLHILLGILAGIRELFRQPYKRGLIGFPLGIIFFLCSLFGSIFDMMARIFNTFYKGLDRAQQVLLKKVGVQAHRHQSAKAALAHSPTSFMEGILRGLLVALAQCEVVALDLLGLFRWFVHRCQHRWWASPFYFLLFIITFALTLLMGLLSATLLSLHMCLQGLVMSLFRISAEAVSDMDPLQVFALELPTHLRPIRPLHREEANLVVASTASGGSATSQFNGSAAARRFRNQASAGHGTAASLHAGLKEARTGPFSFLTALAQSQIGHEDWRPSWLRIRDPMHDDLVRSTVFCGSHGDGDTTILVETTQHIALLHVTGWGNVGPSGRPARPKPTYRWTLRLKRSEIASVILCAPHVGKLEWHLKLELFPGPFVGHWGTRVISFSDRLQAHRALELLAPQHVSVTDRPAEDMSHSRSRGLMLV